jgi:phage baseplate assembly protein W
MAYEIRNAKPIYSTDTAIGIKLPIVSTDGRLFDLSYSNEEQMLSNLKNLILTRRGERLMQPLFGTNLQDSLFEQNTDQLKNSIIDSITTAVDFWLPYVTIESLTVDNVIVTDASSQEHGVQVVLSVSYNGVLVDQSLTFLVTPTGVEII